MKEEPFLDEHLNVNWLRPESALWDAIASTVVSQFELAPPALDLGAGNGIFSFITAGGGFSIDWDWYRNAELQGFWDDRDIYDAYKAGPGPECLARQSSYRIDVALDTKVNLLRQAEALGFYHTLVAADAAERLPFADGAFQSMFSNMLYWLPSARTALSEIARILRAGGQAVLCLQDDRFKEYCVTYRWRELNSEVLRLLNRGRSESSRWTISYKELVALAQATGFHIKSHSYYLSPLTLRAWDIGLRPLSPVLIRLVGGLDERNRRSIKREWMDIVRPFVAELYQLDLKSGEPGGYHCVCLEKA